MIPNRSIILLRCGSGLGRSVQKEGKYIGWGHLLFPKVYAWWPNLQVNPSDEQFHCTWSPPTGSSQVQRHRWLRSVQCHSLDLFYDSARSQRDPNLSIGCSSLHQRVPYDPQNGRFTIYRFTNKIILLAFQRVTADRSPQKSEDTVPSFPLFQSKDRQRPPGRTRGARPAPSKAVTAEWKSSVVVIAFVVRPSGSGSQRAFGRFTGRVFLKEGW